MNENAAIDMMVYLVLDRLRPRFGSLDEAIEWYACSPVPGFGDETAMSLVCGFRGHRAQHSDLIARGIPR